MMKMKITEIKGEKSIKEWFKNQIILYAKEKNKINVNVEFINKKTTI